MAINFRFPNLNPFAGYFKKARGEDEEIISKARSSNAQGVSQEDTAIQTVGSSTVMGTIMSSQPGEASVTITGVQFEQVFESKRQKTGKYREMSNYSIVEEATDNVCDDAIIEDKDGKIVTLDISKEIPENIRTMCQGYFDYFLNSVIKFSETGWDIFKRWLIDAELYGELILNQKGDNIIGIKLLPPYTMTPIYNAGSIQGFVQVPEKNFQNKKQIDFDRDQIVYISYGKFGESIGDVRGYYEAAIKTYNQLKSMEDAVVVYRLVRSVERRAWNVYTGKMPKPQAEAYVKGLIQRFKKRMIYDPNTGNVNSAQNVIAMTEDYWFGVNAEGQGTKVETLAGGANLGELDDVKFFLEKLYRAMKLPKSRWSISEGAAVSYGKSGEITQEEIHFSRFVERLLNKFKYFILDPYITLLRLRGIDVQYLKSSNFNLRFTQTNLFKEYKEMEVLDARLAILNQFSNFMYSEDNKTGYFAPEFVMRKYFRMSDEDISANDAYLAKLKAELPLPLPEGGEGGGEGGGEEAGTVPGGPEETPPEGGEAPALPPLKLPEPGTFEGGGGEETPPAGAEAFIVRKNKKAIVPFSHKKPKDSELHNKPAPGFDLFADWKRADAAIVKKYQAQKGRIL